MSPTPRVLAALILVSTPIWSADVSSCRASLDGDVLTVANSHIERKWKIANGLLYATSFRDLDSRVEWLAQPSKQPAPYPETALPDDKREITFHKRAGKLNPVEAESLVVDLTTPGPVKLEYRLQVFPDAHGISIQMTGPGAAMKAVTEAANSAANGIEIRPAASRDTPFVVDALENFDLAPRNLHLTQVRLLDQTDYHNELVFEDEWLLHPAESLRLDGDLFYVEDVLTGNGLIFLKEAPLPHSRPIKSETDFVYESARRRVRLMGQGVEPEGGAGYRFIVLAYGGRRTGRIAALQGYQRQLRTFDPARDARFLSNTWGDRSRDARINADFMTQEVRAGAKLGVDVVQIDDGWQHGRSVNTSGAKGLSTGFWTSDPHFWDVDAARFPGGLPPIVKLAAENGMRFGLWFAPDSSNDFGNWHRDAEKIVELHISTHIDYVKIDGVKAVSKPGERNLRRFFDEVLDKTAGAVTFDLDVTAQTRPGYFGMMNTGPIFVENRYTDWHRYWPHQTLRNLWKLSQFVDPLRLRMELLNNARNANQYAGDPLAPSEYSPSYLFATTMFANPLGWFETSNLPPAYIDDVAPLVKRWKLERAQIFANTILPIGEAPDGVTWTGFVSVAADHQSGYALIFREDNPAAEWRCALPLFDKQSYAVTKLGGAGTASATNGNLDVRIPAARQFVWLKLEAR